MPWNDSLEQLTAKLADEAQVMAKLHKTHHESFSRKHRRLNLPVVILSTLCASLNFFSGSVEKNIERWIIVGCGVLSVVTSILSSISQFLKLAEKSGSHLVAENLWLRFYNRLIFQLKLTVNMRQNPEDFLVEIENEYQRLYEMSPDIQSHFIAKMKRTFDGNHDEHFRIPHFLNGQHATTIYDPGDD